LDKKKIIIICVAVGAVALIAAAIIIFSGILADRPPPHIAAPTQQAVNHAQQPTREATAAPSAAPTLPSAPGTAQPAITPTSEIAGLAVVSVNPALTTATITLPNGNIITGKRSVASGTTLFTFYTDGSTETIRLQAPDNMVLVCTDDATIEQMDARNKSYIKSRQASPSDYFTKAYGGAVINLTNYLGGKLDIWCAAN